MPENTTPIDIDKLYPKIDQNIPKGLNPAYKKNIPSQNVREKLLEILGIEELPQNISFDVNKPKENQELIEIHHLYYDEC